MKKQQRRVFLKVIATVPLMGCGADPSDPGALGAGGANAAGAANARGGAGGASGHSSLAGGGSSPSNGGSGSPLAGGGSSPSNAGGSSSSSGGASSSHGGGSSMGGSPVASGGASAGGTSVAGGDPNDPTSPIGNVSLYPLGSFSIAGNIYFLGHDAGGLYAMSMQCTHAFCAVTISGSELDCPCHGSRFDRKGNVLQGPATKPLPYYKVSVDGTGNITVDRFTVVSASTRTPV